jgi:hypothetical protein
VLESSSSKDGKNYMTEGTNFMQKINLGEKVVVLEELRMFFKYLQVELETLASVSEVSEEDLLPVVDLMC